MMPTPFPLFLPPYSPGLNQIEQMFAKLKALLRKAAARSLEDLWRTIGCSLDLFTAGECGNYFQNSGYAFNQAENALGGGKADMGLGTPQDQILPLQTT